MEMASKKQINYFKQLYPKWVQKLKREYRYFDRNATSDFIDTVHANLEIGKPVKKIYISQAIGDILMDLNDERS